MTQTEKDTLLALIRGLKQDIGNQYYSEYVIKEQGIKTLENFIKNS